MPGGEQGGQCRLELSIPTSRSRSSVPGNGSGTTPRTGANSHPEGTISASVNGWSGRSEASPPTILWFSHSGEEGVHNSESACYPISKGKEPPHSRCGHLPLKSSTDNSHQA